MRQSRLIRFGLLFVILGAGFLGARRIPILLSQEGDRIPATVVPMPVYPAPAGGLPGAGGGGSVTPPAALSADIPPPGTPGEGIGIVQFEGVSDVAGGAPPALGGGAGPMGQPPGGGYMPPGGMMGSGMGMPGMPGMGMGTRPMSKSQQEEMQLAFQAKALLNQYGKEPRAEVKEKLKSDLRAVLHRQFRLQHQRRDAELQSIERRLADLRSKLKKRGDAQSTIVDRRLEQLISDIDGLGWTTEDVPDNLFLEPVSLPPMSGSGMMGPAPGSTGSPAYTPVAPPQATPSSGGPPSNSLPPSDPNDFDLPPADSNPRVPPRDLEPTVPSSTGGTPGTTPGTTPVEAPEAVPPAVPQAAPNPST